MQFSVWGHCGGNWYGFDGPGEDLNLDQPGKEGGDSIPHEVNVKVLQRHRHEVPKLSMEFSDPLIHS